MPVGAGMEQPLDAKLQNPRELEGNVGCPIAGRESKVCSQHCIHLESCDGLIDVCSKVSFLAMPF